MAGIFEIGVMTMSYKIGLMTGSYGDRDHGKE
jgi:hypothetical protein